ncbi:hypothetical protein FOZ63_011351 [Perkinsus olseni]|uniref:Uncharacterized protein n=1 Tax=Perkinsus olseni TaxID=32597 RepID=A0A7J6QET2_PEROL|nr:hypothetical protein FOZ63_011351 [Perkinsus olseni]KAF4729719.1 hypothetical protein FOZ62_012675 [Perkinsus olseni]
MFTTDVGQEYSCGDVYILAADASNVPRDGARLVQFVKDFRGRAPSMTEDGFWAGDFVNLFELLIAPYLQEEGPIGISFNAAFDKATWSHVFDAVEDSRRYYASLDSTRNYTFKVDARLDHLYNKEGVVEEVMRRADHASVTAFSSTRTGLLEMFRTFLTRTCPHCNDDFYGTSKAKITFVANGECNRRLRGQSFCDYFTPAYNPNRPKTEAWFLFSSEGVQKAHEELQASINAIPREVIVEDKFEHLFEDNGTVMGLDDFEESKCIYGVDVLRAINFNPTYCSLDGCIHTSHTGRCVKVLEEQWKKQR